MQKRYRGTARDRQACGCSHGSAWLDVYRCAGSVHSLCGLPACRVVAPAKTIKISEAFPTRPLDVKRLKDAVKFPGCLHGDVCCLTDLEPLCPAKQGLGLEQKDSDCEANYHGNELRERIVFQSTHGVRTGSI